MDFTISVCIKFYLKDWSKLKDKVITPLHKFLCRWRKDSKGPRQEERGQIDLEVERK